MDSMPNEIWRLLLCVRIKANVQECGIGFDLVQKSLVDFHEMFGHLLVVVRKQKCAPMMWHRSQAFSFFNQDPSQVELLYDAQRTVHTLGPVGKAF